MLIEFRSSNSLPPSSQQHHYRCDCETRIPAALWDLYWSLGASKSALDFPSSIASFRTRATLQQSRDTRPLQRSFGFQSERDSRSKYKVERHRENFGQRVPRLLYWAQAWGIMGSGFSFPFYAQAANPGLSTAGTGLAPSIGLQPASLSKHCLTASKIGTCCHNSCGPGLRFYEIGSAVAGCCENQRLPCRSISLEVKLYMPSGHFSDRTGTGHESVASCIMLHCPVITFMKLLRRHTNFIIFESHNVPHNGRRREPAFESVSWCFGNSTMAGK
jgi:hypothetical protein